MNCRIQQVWVYKPTLGPQAPFGAAMTKVETELLFQQNQDISYNFILATLIIFGVNYYVEVKL